MKEVEPRFLPAGTLNAAAFDESYPEECGQDLGDTIQDYYMERRAEWPEELAQNIERNFILRCIDQNWTKHIDAMARLREGIHLRSYANINPLQDYVNEGYKMFRECLNIASVDAVLNLVNVKVEKKPVEEQTEENKGEVIDAEVEEKKE